MLDDKRRALVDSLDSAFRFLRWVAIVVVVVVLGSGITFVKSDEAALVLRFGKLAGATPTQQVHGPGILIAWPYLIDRVVRVPVKRVQEVPITLFNGKKFATVEMERGREDAYMVENTLDPRAVGYCVTGDDNIVHVDAVVKYEITDPISYELHLDQPQKVIHDVACSALTQAIGATKVDDVLAEGKKALGNAVRKRLQTRLDEIEAGVGVIAVEFREIIPPEAVAPDFEAVVSAYVEKQTKVQEAQTYRQKELPKAQAERSRLISDAEAFSADRLGRARGEVSTFRNVFAEYKANPGVVRERLYREAVEKTLSKVGTRVIMPQDAGDGSRVMLPVERPKQEEVPRKGEAGTEGAAKQ